MNIAIQDSYVYEYMTHILVGIVLKIVEILCRATINKVKVPNDNIAEPQASPNAPFNSHRSRLDLSISSANCVG